MLLHLHPSQFYTSQTTEVSLQIPVDFEQEKCSSTIICGCLGVSQFWIHMTKSPWTLCTFHLLVQPINYSCVIRQCVCFLSILLVLIFDLVSHHIHKSYAILRDLFVKFLEMLLDAGSLLLMNKYSFLRIITLAAMCHLQNALRLSQQYLKEEM